VCHGRVVPKKETVATACVTRAGNGSFRWNGLARAACSPASSWDFWEVQDVFGGAAGRDKKYRVFKEGDYNDLVRHLKRWMVMGEIVRLEAAEHREEQSDSHERNRRGCQRQRIIHGNHEARPRKCCGACHVLNAGHPLSPQEHAILVHAVTSSPVCQRRNRLGSSPSRPCRSCHEREAPRRGLVRSGPQRPPRQPRRPGGGKAGCTVALPP
jgi:hypothetical protein